MKLILCVAIFFSVRDQAPISLDCVVNVSQEDINYLTYDCYNKSDFYCEMSYAKNVSTINYFLDE